MRFEMNANHHHVWKPKNMETHFTVEFQTGNGGYAYIKLRQDSVGSLIRKLNKAHSEWMEKTYPEFVQSSTSEVKNDA